MNKSKIELSVIIPCLNEEDTLKDSIEEAFEGIKISGIHGEVIVSDNGSTDNSVSIAKKSGAKVFSTDIKGYGAALINGLNNASGEFIVMADADMTYNFLDIPKFIKELDSGYDLVIGNRFLGGIEKGAMPFLNKYIGNPLLSSFAKLFFGSVVNDYHCGLRAIKSSAYRKLNLKSVGMEFATEMIAKASLLKLKIIEIPTTLRKSPVERTPHLKPLRDGLRHLHLIFSYGALKTSKNFINTLGGLSGIAYLLLLFFAPITIGQVQLSVNSLLISSIIFLVSIIMKSQLTLTQSIFPKYAREFREVQKSGLLQSLLLILFGFIIFVYIFIYWYSSSFSELNTFPIIKYLSLGIVSTVYGINEFLISLIYNSKLYFLDDN